MEKLKAGLIGVGGISKGAHIPAYKRIPEVEIVAVCELTAEKCAAAERAVGKPVKKYTDYKEMIKNEKLDFVDICTPNYLHSEISVFALDNGLNVFCEKPDATSVKEVEAMRDAEIRSGKRLMVMRNNRYLKTSEELKKMAEDGVLGDIYAGRCGWIRRRGIPGKGGWFTTKALSGGGPLIDLGVHMIDLAIYIMGNPKAVSVTGSTFTKFANSEDKSDSVHSTFGEVDKNGVFDVEDLAMGFVKFDNGACLQIEFSWASNIKREKHFVELRGSNGGFSWNGVTYELFFGKKTGAFKVCREKLRQLIGGGRGHYRNLRHFIDVLTKGVTPVYTVDQGINMIKILTGIYRSAAENREIILN